MPFTIEIPEPRNSRADASAVTSFAERGGLAELSEFYRQLGFDAGYAQAVRDQLELSVVTAEQILREQNLREQNLGEQNLGEQILRERNALTGPGDARRLIYAFIARLDRKLSLFSDSTLARDSDHSEKGLEDRQNEKCNEGYLEGGMGI